MMQFKIITISFFAILLAVFTTSSLSAQEGNPRREVGIQFSSLDFDGGTGAGKKVLEINLRFTILDLRLL